MKVYSLQDSYEECRQLNNHYGTLFYHAINQFPKKDQPSVQALCAYMRILDEIVDHPNDGVTKISQEAAIKQVMKELKKELEQSFSPHPYRQAIVHTASFHALPKQQLEQLAKAKIKDLKKKRYKTYAELQKHLDETSGILAELLTHAIGYKHKRAFQHTKQLLRAGHLIEIICEISEDMELHDRVYIPQQELKKQKATIEAVRSRIMTPELRNVIESLLQKAEKELASFEKGLKHFPESSHKALHTTSQIYQGLMESIRKMNYDIFTRRPDVKWAHRIRCALPF